MSMAVTIAELEAEITSLTAAYAALEAQDAAREAQWQQDRDQMRALDAQLAAAQQEVALWTNRAKVWAEAMNDWKACSERNEARWREAEATIAELSRPCTHPTPEPGCAWCPVWEALIERLNRQDVPSVRDYLLRELDAAMAAVREGTV